jgi:hypothetical protein
MTEFIIIITAMVIGWLIYEYLTPWGTVAKLKEMEDRNE